MLNDEGETRNNLESKKDINDRIARKLLNVLCKREGSRIFDEQSWNNFYYKLGIYGGFKGHRNNVDNVKAVSDSQKFPTMTDFVRDFPSLFKAVPIPNSEKTEIQVKFMCRI